MKYKGDFYKGEYKGNVFTKVNIKGGGLQRDIHREIFTKGNTNEYFYKGKYKEFFGVLKNCKGFLKFPRRRRRRDFFLLPPLAGD